MNSIDRSSREAPIRVGLFNVKYSPNLGDGLLSECLESELVRAVPGLTVRSFDLAGRTTYGDGGRLRGAALTALQHSPTTVRHTIARVVIGRSLHSRIRPGWRHGLGSIDAVVAGGGNLFSDTDLNFPLKIGAALDEVRTAGIPAAVFGVGVSDNWSAPGEALFRRALVGSRLVYASVRDARSADVWKRRLEHAGIRSARIVHDPGLLVARHVLQRRRPNGRAPLIGLGLTHPSALRYHADEPSVGEATLTAWYVALLRGCLAQGWQVTVFTNGSPEDDAYLRQLGPALSRIDGAGRIAFEPRFRRPSDLASFISGLDLLMAHRLHANIAAYSYAVPQVGFSWDSKLKSFFAQVGRSEYIATAGIDSVDDTLALAARALREGLDPARHAAILGQARDDVADLAEALLSAVAHPRDARQAGVAHEPAAP